MLDIYHFVTLFTAKIGEDEAILYIFETGWFNHQLVKTSVCMFLFSFFLFKLEVPPWKRQMIKLPVEENCEVEVEQPTTCGFNRVSPSSRMRLQQTPRVHANLFFWLAKLLIFFKGAFTPRPTRKHLKCIECWLL